MRRTRAGPCTTRSTSFREKDVYDKDSPQVWLQSFHHYMAGRTEDMDRVLDWVEKQQSEIPRDLPSMRGLPMINCAEYHEVSRQLWALLGPLVAGNSVVNGVFENVDRHNGLEAWRRIDEPIDEDKSLILQALGAGHEPQGCSEPRRFRICIGGVGHQYLSV